MNLRRSRLEVPYNGRRFVVCRWETTGINVRCVQPVTKYSTNSPKFRADTPFILHSATRARRKHGAWCPAACAQHRLLAVLSGMPPASGRAYDESAPCPLMELLLHRAALKEGIVLDVGANGGCEMTAALRQGLGGGARTLSLILGQA